MQCLAVYLPADGAICAGDGTPPQTRYPLPLSTPTASAAAFPLIASDLALAAHGFCTCPRAREHQYR